MKYRLTQNGKTLRTGDRFEYAAMRQLINDGFEVYKRGWPDFVAVKGDMIRFIEMKGPYAGSLKPHQKKICEILTRAGCAVEVWKKEGRKEPTEDSGSDIPS